MVVAIAWEELVVHATCHIHMEAVVIWDVGLLEGEEAAVMIQDLNVIYVLIRSMSLS